MKTPQVDLSNPVLIYTVIWTFVLALVSIKLTYNIPTINGSTFLLIFMTMFTFMTSYIILYIIHHTKPTVKLKVEIIQNQLEKLNKYTRKLFYIWIVVTVIEVIYSGGLPIIWAIAGDYSQNYTNYGIPTVHGFMNAIYFFIILSRFVNFMVYKDRRSLIQIILLILWSISLLSRSVIVTAFLQIIGAYLLFRRVSILRLVSIVGAIAILVIVFGLVGDFRGVATLDYLLTDEGITVFEYLPSGFLWVYVYLTSPISNVIANIDNVSPNYIPYFSIINLVPSFLRGDVVQSGSMWSWSLIQENLNVSTMFQGYLLDFGIIGTIFIVSIIQVSIIKIYLMAKRRKIGCIIAASVLFQCIICSVFVDFFSSLVYLSEIAIAMAFDFSYKRSIKKFKKGNFGEKIK